MADSPVAVDDGKASISAVAAKLFRDGDGGKWVWKDGI